MCEPSLPDRSMIVKGCGVVKAGGGGRMEAPDPVPGRQAMQAAISRTKRGAQKRGLTLMGQPSLKECSGGVLLSHEASLAVPSALKSLTSGFGMGPGVSPSLWPPGTLSSYTASGRNSGATQWTRYSRLTSTLILTYRKE